MAILRSVLGDTGRRTGISLTRTMVRWVEEKMRALEALAEIYLD